WWIPAAGRGSVRRRSARSTSRPLRCVRCARGWSSGGGAGGRSRAGAGPPVYNFNQAFQNYSPSLEARQAYLEWRGRSAEVRAGIQTFAWGKLDGIAPTDVVNPRDWHDPLVVDEFFEEQKIGIPALLG